jgi:Sec-independent protein translocase protein TatA
MLAFLENIGGTELLIVMVVGLLVFGKKLPQVAGDAAKQLVKLRRSLDEAWRDTGMQQEIQSVKRDIETAIPRDLSIGDMARLASAEMDKRIRANEEAARAEKQVEPTAGTSTAAAPPDVARVEKPPDKPTTTIVDFN